MPDDKPRAETKQDEDSISRTIRELEHAWRLKPDLTFGQLVSALLGFRSQDLVHVPDDTIHERIVAWIADPSPKVPKNVRHSLRKNPVIHQERSLG